MDTAFLKRQKTAEIQNNVYSQELNAFDFANATLQESQFKVAGTTHKDSESMSEVKGNVAVLRQFMDTSIPTTVAQFEQQLATLDTLYHSAIHACQVYTSKHKPWTSSGKARLATVRGTLSLLEGESLLLKESAKKIFESEGNTGDVTWANVLGEIRQSTINLDNIETKKTGAGTSDVTVIGSGENALFFKDEEKLTPTYDAFVANHPEQTDVKKKTSGDKIRDAFAKAINSTNFMDAAALTAVGKQFISRNIDLSDDVQWKSKVTCYMDNSPTLAHLAQCSVEERALVKSHFVEISRSIVGNTIAQTFGIESGSKLTTRNVATSRLAKILGASDLVADSQTVVLSKEGEPLRKGNAMRAAKGIPLSDAINQCNAGNETEYSPEAIKQLTNLYVLDLITGQVDRNTGNIFVTTEVKEGKTIIKSIQGIDNDMCFTNLTAQTIEGDNQMLPAFKNKDKKVDIPGLDRQLLDRITAMSKEVFTYALADLVSQTEIDAAYARLESVRDDLTNFSNENPNACYQGDWNQDAIERTKTLRQANTGNFAYFRKGFTQ